MAKIIEPGPRIKQYRCTECLTLFEVDLMSEAYKLYDAVIGVDCPNCDFSHEVPSEDVTNQVLRKHCPFLFD